MSHRLVRSRAARDVTFSTLALLACAALAACAESRGPGAGGGAPDGGSGAPDGGSGPSGAVWSAWDPGLPDTATLPRVAGLRVARGIIHLHSPFSHDACDGEGFVDGVFNEPCLGDLRRALCTTRQDFAFLTDHPAHMAEQPFDALLLARPGDEPVTDATGRVVATRIACENGARPLVFPGYEDELMPIMMNDHAPGDAAARGSLYNGYDAATVAAMRATGARILIAHTEQRDVAELDALGVDGVEVYNLHANLDPKIRERWLGLEGGDAAAAALPFWLHPETAPLPDLMALAFLDLPRVSIAKWEALTLHRRTLGTAGTDAHQNVFPIALADGERGDSYRRNLRWFSNHLLVDAPTPEGLRAALDAHRWYVAFEVLGTPAGFGFDATWDAGPDVHARLGDELVGTGVRFHVTMPTLAQGAADDGSTPELHARLVRVSGTFEAPLEETIAEGAGDLDAVAPGPGVYHVEITMIPHHLRRWMGADPAPYLRRIPWIFSAPYYVR